MLAGLKDRMMAPEMAAEAMRAYAEETNRPNRERRANGGAWRTELTKVEKAIAGIVAAIEDGLYQPSMKSRMEELERQKADLTARLAEAPADVPDIHPNVSGVYRKKVERLTDALNKPEDRVDAAEAIRGLVEKITLRPGPNRGEIDATLQGELGTILGWIVSEQRKIAEILRAWDVPIEKLKTFVALIECSRKSTEMQTQLVLVAASAFCPITNAS